ncbi:MAG: ATP-binding protein [Verrucomicrobiales bacterium]|nr:ATP-binding protein [Verrucomicrobiales bacterium]
MDALRRATQFRQFAAGQQIFAEGDRGDGIYLIQSGHVQISAVVSHGQPRILSRLGPGEFFGEMAVLDSGPRSAAAIAEETTVTGFIPRDELLGVLQSSPRLAVNLVREFSLRLRDFNRQYIREVLEAERLALVGRFARSIVHDFKNPLNVISLAAEMAARDSATPVLRQTQKTRICKQVDRLNSMINELLDFTRGSQNPVVLSPTPYATFIQQLIEELRPELKDKRVSITCDNDPPDAELLLDPTRLTRVFFNLVNNAVDAMPDGGSVRLRFKVTPQEVATEIEDSGKGIAPEIAPRMFEPFATYGKAQGTGLGLSICRRIIEDHRGRIFARNEPGHGAIFVFILPLPPRAP